MLESFVVLLVCVGVLFMILSFKWESIMFSSISLVIWMGLSIGIHQIEIPYTAITSGDVVVTGTQNIENLYMYSVFFLALAIIMILHLVSLAFKLYQGHEKRIM